MTGVLHDGETFYCGANWRSAEGSQTTGDAGFDALAFDINGILCGFRTKHKLLRVNL